MNSNIVNVPISFWDLIKENKIQIPIIQRDYAQGRKDKVDLRRNFLHELKESLENGRPLLLDFVYGTNNNGISPLDGQQRLTTLWLLHWYLAFRKGEKRYATILKKFSYRTRTSSRDFITNLCSLIDDKPKQPKEGVAQYIQNQTWFSYSWKQDPTIQAMLIMLSGWDTDSRSGRKFIPNRSKLLRKRKKIVFRLRKTFSQQRKGDGIEPVFEKNVFVLEKLFQSDCPIKFYYLSLEGIKQSDDLYVKMNHRGEQLTDFENFKADLVGYMRKKENDNLNAFVDVNDTGKYIIAKLDTTWADLFWNPIEIELKSDLEIDDEEKADLETDDLFFLFVKLFFADSLLEDYKNNKNLIRTIQEQQKLKYTSFYIYEKVVTKKVIDNLRKTLENIPKGFNELIRDAVPLIKNSDFFFLPERRKKDGEKNKLVIKYPKTAQERLLFHSICQFLIYSDTPIYSKDQQNNISLTKNFMHWLRLSANFAYSRTIESEKQIFPRISLVDGITSYLNSSEGWANVYSTLEKYNGGGDAIASHEIEKIKIILSNSAVEQGVMKLEGMLLFGGWIDCFLEDVCSVCHFSNVYCHKYFSIFERKFDIFNNNNWTKAEKADLYNLFKACLVEYSELSPSNIDLQFTSMHDGYQKTFSNGLKQSFKKVMVQLLQNHPVNSIIDGYKNRKQRNEGWYTPLILDDNNVLWNYAKIGYIRERSNKVFLYFKQNSNQNKDIDLLAFYNRLSRSRIDLKDITSVEKKDDKWYIKDNNNNSYVMEKDYSNVIDTI